MIRACCPECRLRCSPAAAMYLDRCPCCGGELQSVSSLRDIVGFQLARLHASPPAEAAAVAVAIAYPNASGANAPTGRHRATERGTNDAG